jgi:hypothetical protein
LITLPKTLATKTVIRTNARPVKQLIEEFPINHASHVNPIKGVNGHAHGVDSTRHYQNSRLHENARMDTRHVAKLASEKFGDQLRASNDTPMQKGNGNVIHVIDGNTSTSFLTTQQDAKPATKSADTART